MSSSSLSRLARSLAGGPVDAPRSPPEGRKVSPPWDTPKPVEAPPAPPERISEATNATARGDEAVEPPRPHYAPRLLTALGKTQSILRWSQELGLDRRVLAWRLDHGWPTEQALGLVPHPPRDRAAEQAASAAVNARVQIVEQVAGKTRIIPRAEAAARLGIKIRSLTHRLRQYRPADGSSAQVPFSLLDRR